MGNWSPRAKPWSKSWWPGSCWRWSAQCKHDRCFFDMTFRGSASMVLFLNCFWWSFDILSYFDLYKRSSKQVSFSKVTKLVGFNGLRPRVMPTMTSHCRSVTALIIFGPTDAVFVSCFWWQYVCIGIVASCCSNYRASHHPAPNKEKTHANNWLLNPFLSNFLDLELKKMGSPSDLRKPWLFLQQVLRCHVPWSPWSNCKGFKEKAGTWKNLGTENLQTNKWPKKQQQIVWKWTLQNNKQRHKQITSIDENWQVTNQFHKHWQKLWIKKKTAVPLKKIQRDAPTALSFEAFAMPTSIRSFWGSCFKDLNFSHHRVHLCKHQLLRFKAAFIGTQYDSFTNMILFYSMIDLLIYGIFRL